MSFLEILNMLLLKPIQLFFEIIYMIAYEVTDNPGISIIVLSLVMNFLLLPLYNRADRIQEEERETEQKLHQGVFHIKKTFRGDERMMILQTYYRQNHYKPTHVLRGGVSLCLEIPFFMAAYVFLSHLLLLQGVSFGPIPDLGQPDAMITAGNLTVNVLPILMTVINIVASLLYTKGSPLKAKVQLYVMAAVFLVVLYQSPSGLVLYWTLNNLFSLVKTLVNRMPDPKKFLTMLLSFAGVGLFVYGLIFHPAFAIKSRAFYCIVGLLLQIPIFCRVLNKGKSPHANKNIGVPNGKAFVFSGLFLALLTGILIPSAVISASPQEFIGPHFYHPLWYVCGSLCMGIGTFMIWANVFYYLANKDGKILMEKVMVVVSFAALVDYMFFGRHYGMLTPTLQYENGFDVSWKERLFNLAVLALVVATVIFILDRWKKIVTQLTVIACIALVCMSGINMVKIAQSVKNAENAVAKEQNGDIKFKLSKNAQNVVVIMLDRAYGGYIPFFLNEKPELKELFDGFTYYSNVISYGGHTNFGAPALFGGYEYTPLEMNKRKDELLVSKHNEALKVMPAIFGKNGYEVTVADLPDINYQNVADNSFFDEIPNTHAFSMQGKFSSDKFDDMIAERRITCNQRNFFCYSLLKIIPSIAQESLYQNGTYRESDAETTFGQYILNNCISNGINPYFIDAYNVLTSLPAITEIEDTAVGQFILMDNNTAHNQALLQEPEYVPAQHVDNTEYEQKNSSRFNTDGLILPMDTDLQYRLYQSNMAALLQLGNWLEYLRKNDVYDNTRIILVADHGFGRELLLGNLMEEIDGEIQDYNWYYPLLMVKDFDSTGFTISDEFMTNGDVPTLATEGVIEHPVNPFTGKEINDEMKNNGKQYVIGSHEWDLNKNNGNTFLPSVWYTVHDNIWNLDNWEILEEEMLP